jgi:hypothetical protein
VVGINLGANQEKIKENLNVCVHFDANRMKVKTDISRG